METVVKVIATDLWFPEGPVWLGDGSLVLVEMRRQTLTRVWMDGSKAIVATLGGGPNGAAIGPDGHCYVCNNGGFQWCRRADGNMVNVGPADDSASGRIEWVNIDTGEFRILYDQCDGMRLRGPNDLVFDAHGGFYFSDPGKTRSHDSDRGCVYYAKADGSLIKPLIFPISRPNGIGLSPDGRTLYVAETETARLWAWSLAGPGELISAPQMTHVSPHGGRLLHVSPVYARFDSLKVEANGSICVANLDRGGITVVPPDGTAATFVSVPGDTHLTNLCFGQDDLKTAYFTQAYRGQLLAMEWPRPGLPLNYLSNRKQ
jgi:gluconolactonase